MFKILLLILTALLITVFTKSNSTVGSTKKTDPIVTEANDSSEFDPFNYKTIKSNESKAADVFKCNSHGPYTVGDCGNITIRFTYTLYSISSQRIIDRVRLISTSGSVLYSATKAAVDYATGTLRTVAFTNIPLGDYYTSNGLTLKFEILNASTYAIIKGYSATFYPIVNGTVSIGTLRKKIYTSRSFGFKGDGEKMVELTESFDFTNVGTYVNVNNYYYLDLTKNVFQYLDDYTLTCTSVNLRFKDNDNVFPYFTHQSNGDIVVPLTLYKNKTAVTFKYQNSFYVNKKTLQISDIYRQDFVSTNKFYLPINGKRLFNNKWLYIDIKGLGINKISTSVSLKFNVNRNLVGVCSDGDYCVTGGSR